MAVMEGSKVGRARGGRIGGKEEVAGRNLVGTRGRKREIRSMASCSCPGISAEEESSRADRQQGGWTWDWDGGWSCAEKEAVGMWSISQGAMCRVVNRESRVAYGVRYMV